jgi:predicted hotdog family 3-hydroxylacyl-ACP dehydratase
MPKVILKNITQIVPHRSPMLMIDAYSKIDNNNALSEKTFQEGSYGCQNGVVIDSILIECVAQTVAAHYGYQLLEEENTNFEIGLLVSVDKFDFYYQVREKSKIDIIISKIDQIGAFKLFKGEIRMEIKMVAAGNIKVFNPEKENV